MLESFINCRRMAPDLCWFKEQTTTCGLDMFPIYNSLTSDSSVAAKPL